MVRGASSKVKDKFFNDEYFEKKMINCIMQGGKKNVAEKIYYGAADALLKFVNENFKDESVSRTALIAKCVKAIQPMVEVKSRRVGGSTYPVPSEVRAKRAAMLSVIWIISAARKKNGEMMKNLASELISIYFHSLSSGTKLDGVRIDKSESMTKKENVHKMAEANKAFAHFGSK